MPTPEQIERAKKLIEEQERRSKLVNRYDIKIPETLNRAVHYFLDMSGTPEADRKNIEFLRSLNTPDGQQKMIAKAYDAIFGMDLSVYLSDDIDTILDAEEANPYLSQLAFAIHSINDTMSSQLKPAGEVKNTLNDFLPAWEMCGTHVNRMMLIANDIDINEPLGGATLDDMSKNPEKFMKQMPMFSYISGVLIHKKESADYIKALDKLAQMGISGSDVYYSDYYDENKNPITFEAALAGINGGKQISAVLMTDEKKEERKNQLKHFEPFGVRTWANARTPLSMVPGVTGIGVSTRTTRTIDGNEAQSGFYGGLEVSEEIKKELEGQNVSAILNFDQGENGAYRISYKIPERGSSKPHSSINVSGDSEKIFSGGEFNIRRNVNYLTKTVAGILFDENDTLTFGPNTEKLFTARDIINRAQSNSRTVEELHNGVNRFLDTLEIPAGAEREDLFTFLTASQNNTNAAMHIVNSCLRDVKQAANYSNLTARKNNQELDNVQGDAVTRAYGAYINTVTSLRRMKNMDIDAQTEIPYNMDSGSAAGVYLGFIFEHNELNPDKSINAERLDMKVSGYCNKHPKPMIDGVNPAEAHDVISALSINGVSIGGRNITLSFENIERKNDELMFNAGSFAAIGVYENPEKIKDAVFSDAFVSESNILTVTTLTDGAEYNSEMEYDVEEDGVVVISEVPAAQLYSKAEDSVGSKIDADSFIELAANLEEGFEQHKEAIEAEISRLNRSSDMCSRLIDDSRREIENEKAQYENDVKNYEANRKLLSDTQAEYERTLAEWDAAKEKIVNLAAGAPGAAERYAEHDRAEAAFRAVERGRAEPKRAVENVDNNNAERKISRRNEEIRSRELTIANNNAALKKRVSPIEDMPEHISNLISVVGSLDKKNINSFEKITELQNAAKECLKHIDPGLSGKNYSKLDTFEHNCYNCAKSAYQFACGKYNEHVCSYIADNKQTAFSFIRFYSCAAKERDAYLAQPEVGKAVKFMEVAAKRSDSFVDSAASESSKKELRCKTELFKTILSGMEYLKAPKKYAAAHPNIKVNALLARADLASKFCNAYAQAKKYTGADELPEFKTSDNRSLTLEEAAEHYLTGQPVIAFNAHSKRFGAEITPNGAIAPKVNPDIPRTSIEDCTSMLTSLNKSLGETDNIAVWTNSKIFKDLRTILTDMTDPKKHWTRTEKLNALPWIEDSCEKYLVKKQKELKEKGSLDNRSRARVNIVRCIKAVASNFKVPASELEQMKAAEADPVEMNPDQPNLG